MTDANILITLFDVNGVSVLPGIAPTEVLDVVLGECEHESQPGLRDAVAAAGIGIVPTDLSWIVQEAYARGLMSSDELCRWIRTWTFMGRRLPVAELERLRRDLEC